MQEERLQLADESGRPAGSATRRECHGNPALIHLVVHLHLFDGKGNLFLQKRSPAKDSFPGRWDTAVGGHVEAGEPVSAALEREAREELGVQVRGARFLFQYLYGGEWESEYVHTFALTRGGEPHPNPREISAGRFWSAEQIEARLGRGVFTPNFEQEYRRLIEMGLLPGLGRK